MTAATYNLTDHGLLPEQARDLAGRYAEGCDEALSELYDRYADPLWRFVIVRTKDAALADDVTGEAWLRAVEKRSKFDPDAGTFLSWMQRLALNLLIDYYRTRSRRGTLDVPGSEMLTADLQWIHTGAGPEDQAVSGDTREHIVAALRGLPRKQRDVLIARFFEGLTVAETSATLGLTESAVKMQQYRGLRGLRVTCATFRDASPSRDVFPSDTSRPESAGDAAPQDQDIPTTRGGGTR